MNGRGEAWRAHVATVALALLGLTLYGRGLLLGFVGDDFNLLDAALRNPLGELLTGRHGLAGFYRPVSRELYFWWWGKVLHLGPLGFHAVNALTYAAVAVMIGRFAGRWAGPRIGRLAVAAFVLFPPGSALLAWVSCAQDLIALFWAAAALLLYQASRHRLAAVAVTLAALSKETALVLPLALLALDVLLHPRVPLRERFSRWGPSFLGVAVAITIALAVRATWPPATRATIWSAQQLASAWRLPFDFASVFFPPDTLLGIILSLRLEPVLPILAAALAAWVGMSAATASEPPRPDRAAAAPASGSAVEAQRSPRARGEPRTLWIFGIVLALVASLPLALVAERWRAYYFSLAGVGASLVVGALLARTPPALAAGLLAVAAVVNFGAGSIYRPVETAAGPARHPHANYAFFRDTGALSNRLLAGLEPWCAAIRSLPRTFAAAIPPDAVFGSVLGPGLRVTCRDTTQRVRFLADFTSADARTDFGVLRLDPGTGGFMLERADTRVRARIGEGFLIHARYEEAAACFEAAAAGQPVSRELSYPLVSALAAAERGAEAERLWTGARARGATLDPVTMAGRMFGRVIPAPSAPDPALTRIGPLVSEVLGAPWRAEPHVALGRELLAAGRAREATFELSIAAGITRKAPEVAWLAQGYEAMGALEEALAAYRRALSTGLPRDVYTPTRDRYLALARRTGALLDQPQRRP